MRTILLSVFLLSHSISFSQGAWTQKAGYPGGTGYATGFAIGSKGYIGTGWDSTGSPTNVFWEYDPFNDTWTQKANVGGAGRSAAVGFAIGTKGYIATGSSSSGFLNDLWEYDPSMNTWQQKASFPGTSRMYATAFSVSGKGYVGTGLTSTSGNSAQNDFWEYDPANDSWSQLSFPGIARGPGVAFTILSKAYFGTGNDTNDQPTNDLWEFDPAGNTWTQKANMPVIKCGATGFAIGTRGYIGTGQGPSSGNSRDFYAYDIFTNSWSQVADFGGAARRHAVGFSIGSRGYAATGSGYADLWEFDPNGVGIPEIASIPYSVFPNPASDFFKLQLNEPPEGKVHLFIYDMEGKIVLNSELVHQTSYIQMNGLANGLYQYKITANGQQTGAGKLTVIK